MWLPLFACNTICISYSRLCSAIFCNPLLITMVCRFWIGLSIWQKLSWPDLSCRSVKTKSPTWKLYGHWASRPCYYIAIIREDCFFAQSAICKRFICVFTFQRFLTWRWLELKMQPDWLIPSEFTSREAHY